MRKGEFKIGDRVTGCNFVQDIEINGMQGIIVEGLRSKFVFHWRSLSLEVQRGYTVRWANGEVNAIAHANLYQPLPDHETLGWARHKVAKLFFPMPLLPK